MTRRLGIATAMLLFACCSSFAQQTNIFGAGVPGRGIVDTTAMPQLDAAATPSPTGEMVAAAALGGAGIPLGTTELFAGGLSPSPTDVTANPTCAVVGTNPGVGTLGTGAIFAGNGTLATSTSDIASSSTPTDSGCGAAASAGVGPLGVTSTVGAAPAFTAGTVPLGATTLNPTGLAGTIGVSAPRGVSPCTLNSIATAGMGLPLGSVPAPSGTAAPGSC